MSVRPPWAPALPILVMGDFCDDVLLRATASRLSREHPIPVLDLEDIAHQGGCAGNIVRQLTAYGVETRLVSLAHAVKIRGLCGASEHEAFRLDAPWESVGGQAIVRQFDALAGVSFAAAVYADYRGMPGPLREERAFLRHLGCPLIADARRSLGGWRDFMVVKANAAEVGLGLGDSDRFLLQAWQRSRAQWLVLTYGAQGYMLGGDSVERFSAVDLPGPVLNTSGAGDVFTATMAAVLGGAHERGDAISRETISEAANLGALAAAHRIRKAGYNEAVTWEEMEGEG